MHFLKKVLIFGILGGALYILLSYHFIFFGIKNVEMLKKSSLTLNYTVFNAAGKDVESILYIDPLREDGIGEILVERGLITQKELHRLIAEIEKKPSYY
jgi:hypothetical protein